MTQDKLTRTLAEAIVLKEFSHCFSRHTEIDLTKPLNHYYDLEDEDLDWGSGRILVEIERQCGLKDLDLVDVEFDYETYFYPSTRLIIGNFFKNIYNFFRGRELIDDDGTKPLYFKDLMDAIWPSLERQAREQGRLDES